ncbi:hypothetical protein TNCV_4433641, partial [Trichonephila clavipes]
MTKTRALSALIEQPCESLELVSAFCPAKVEVKVPMRE